jgi:hypothetical protein
VAQDKRARASREPFFSKTPRTGVCLEAGKQPKIAREPQSIMDRRPSLRLSNMRMKPPFGWDSISREDMKQVIEVGGMCREARQCLAEDWQGGADEALTIRLTNKKRLWGILDGPILYLLWWDRDHAVYPSLPKNT